METKEIILPDGWEVKKYSRKDAIKRLKHKGLL